MFVPIRDINPTRTPPVVTYVLIGANILAWLWQLSLAATGAAWVEAGYGVVPTRLVADPPGEAFTILTSMFMHGSWMHLGGNMLYLYIFGDNVEDALGHWRYLAFYVACGLAAALAQVLTDPVSPIPMVGASGAIAGVLGAYVLLHPKARILVLNPVFLLWFLVGPLLVFPAWLALGTWFVWNLLGILGAQVGQAGGMVAFFAHIGGFLAGVILIWPAMVGRKRRKARPWDGWHPPPRRRSLPPSGPHQDPWFPPDRPR